MRIKVQVHLEAGELIGDAIEVIHDMGLTYDGQEHIGERMMIFASKEIHKNQQHD